MKAKKGNSLLDTRKRNRAFIKYTIFSKEPITRNDIAAELGLTLPTITTSVNEMIGESILEEIPLPEEQLVNTIGRRPVAIGFRADAAYAVGVELGPYATRAVLLNMKGEILYSSQEAPGDESYPVMLGKLVLQIQKVIEHSDKDKLLGVGIGVPGYIDCEKGIIRGNPREDWVGRALAKDLEEILGIPVLINNNARLRAVGYEMSTKGSLPSSYAYLLVSRGIACPLMIRGDAAMSYTACTGEIGEMILCLGGKPSGQRDILDNLAGESKVYEKCEFEMKQGTAPMLQRIVKEAGELTMKQVLAAQEMGEESISSIVEESIEYIGIALANMVNMINPGYVVVDGYIMQSERNTELLRKTAQSCFYSLDEDEVKIVFRPFDHFHGASDAAYFVIRRFFLEH